MNTQRRIAAMLVTILGAGAIVAVAQMAPPAVPPASMPASMPASQPTTTPTTTQAAYNHLLGDDLDRPERPILPTGRPTIDLTSGTNAVAPDAPQVMTLREGSYVKNQVGRLAKAADGDGMEFTFQTDGTGLTDPPMKVLPNLKLGVMEDTIETTNRDLLFRVTGMVTEYRGRNYLLLEKVVVMSDNK